MSTTTPCATPVATTLTIRGRKLNSARSAEIIENHNFYKLLQVRKAASDMSFSDVVDLFLNELLAKEKYKAILKRHGLLEDENIQIIL